MALSGCPGSHQKCPLLKVNRPCHRAAVTSQFDPSATLVEGWWLANVHPVCPWRDAIYSTRISGEDREVTMEEKLAYCEILAALGICLSFCLA